jgi:hypothetical protein
MERSLMLTTVLAVFTALVMGILIGANLNVSITLKPKARLSLSFVKALPAAVRLMWDDVTDLLATLARELPSTTTLPIARRSVTKDTKTWAIAGYYLVRNGSAIESVYLTAYSRFLMGLGAEVTPLNRATIKAAYTAFTPTGAAYSRTRTERTFRIALDTFPSNIGIQEVAA